MPLATVVNYDPTNKTVTVAGDISTASLLSIINQTRGKDLFVVGQTPITNRVFSGGNTTFTLDTNTSGDNAADVLAVRYQASSIITSLGNGVRINGVEHFYQSTPPVTRIDGSTLGIGDRWYNPNTLLEGVWNGLYWLGEKREHGPLRSSNLTASFTNEYLFYPSNPNNLQRALISFYSYGSNNAGAAGGQNASNYYSWSASVSGYSTSYVGATYNSLSGWTNPPSDFTRAYFKNGVYNLVLNYQLAPLNDGVAIVVQNVTRIGNPPAINFYSTWVAIQDIL